MMLTINQRKSLRRLSLQEILVRLAQVQKQRVYTQAHELTEKYAYLHGEVKFLMWAIKAVSYEKVEQIAKNNLCMFFFRRDVYKATKSA